MRIIIQLESWGDITIAEKIIPDHEKRLNNLVDENMQFKISEIELNFENEQNKFNELVEKLKDKNIDSTLKKSLEKLKEKLSKELIKKDEQIADVKIQAEKEKIEIQRVKKELLEMFNDPEKRKKYFSVVDMDEIEENEFNLNIPRYVDTFEPEDEIDLNKAIKEFKEELNKEKEMEKEIIDLLEVFKNG